MEKIAETAARCAGAGCVLLLGRVRDEVEHTPRRVHTQRVLLAQATRASARQIRAGTAGGSVALRASQDIGVSKGQEKRRIRNFVKPAINFVLQFRRPTRLCAQPGTYPCSDLAGQWFGTTGCGETGLSGRRFSTATSRGMHVASSTRLARLVAHTEQMRR